MKALRNYCNLILLFVLFFSISSFSQTTDEDMSQYGKIDSIEFTEVIKGVYVDKSEHSLIIASGSFKSLAYKDTSAVLQLIEVTKNFKWVILISMPSDIDGRAETTYLLIDIENRDMYNDELEKIAEKYISGSDIYFNTSKNGKTCLTYSDKNGKDYTIELK
ncbi:MAG: hypothetical protein GQ534_01480 [Candidatus Delongbacteria bacterium]|nr:hypothetical protein [Candidatus Delongbacteria bacterium]